MSKQGKWITLKLLAGFSIIPGFSIFIFIFVFPYFLWVYWSTYNKLKQPEILAEIEASGFGYIKNWN
ncbi:HYPOTHETICAL PROTEIN MCJ_000780 [Mesomycoplasma conjunctivae]|uniref:Uncharacterized protein n=2 Tax=Mesomycoplasma conjunctivae TaxID=45361 RepID=C5J5N0_MESCH|nr:HYPOTHETICAL PROTEIN MCJ_000780 [Mesomycoplasma conjunctivae]